MTPRTSSRLAWSLAGLAAVLAGLWTWSTYVSPPASKSSELRAPTHEAREGSAISLDGAALVARRDEREPRREPAESIDPALALAVRCVDERGAAIEGAVLRALSYELEERQELGVSDARGGLVVSRVGLEVLSAHHEGYAPVFRSEPAGGWGAEIELRLRPVGTLRGVVLDASGRAVGAGVRVLATRVDRALTPSGVLRALTGSAPWLALTTTDQNGAFELSGLEAEEPHDLHAGGAGWIQAGLPLRCAAGDAAVQLTVHALFGLRVELVGNGGQALPIAPRLSSFGGSLQWTLSHQDGVHGIATSAPTALLAGLPLQHATRLDRHEVVMLFGAESELEKIGPIHLQAHPFGAEELHSTLYAERVREQIPTQRIELGLEARELGRLEIGIRWAGTSIGGPTDRPLAKLVLYERTRQEAAQCSIYSAEETEIVLQGVPAGSYNVDLFLPSVGFQYSACFEKPTAEIAPGATARIDFDLRRAHALRFVLEEPLATYGGRLGLRVDRLIEGSFTEGPMQHLLRPPYVLNGIAPGSYRVECFFPPTLVGKTIPFEIRASSVNEPSVIDVVLR